MLFQDSNVKIIECGKMYQIIDINTGNKHKECKVNLFDTKEQAIEYMKLEDDSEVKVKCGACHDFSLLGEWKENQNKDEVQCPICRGEFKDIIEIEEGMEAGMNCPNCLSDNSETYLETRDNHCLDCGFNWKIADSIDLEEYK